MRLVTYFRALATASTVRQKEDLLKAATDEVKSLLYYTYHPHFKYGMTKVNWTGKGQLYLEEQLAEFILLLKELATTNINQNMRARTQRLIESLYPKDADLACRVIQKDLRSGIGLATINKALPDFIPDFSVMRAKSFKGVVPDGGLFMSLKFDGLRAVYREGQMFTRGGHVINGVEHLTSLLPRSLSFDGEILIPDLHFQLSSGDIRSLNTSPNAVYHIFDIPEPTMIFEKRLHELNKFFASRDADPRVQLVKHTHTRFKSKIEETFTKAIAAGYEGLVLKVPGHRYINKRSGDWMKVKLTETVDIPVIGFFEGEGRLEGTLGGIICDHDGTTVKVGSGFSDELRTRIWKNRNAYLYKIAEVLYHEITPGGSLRHPRLKCFRPDKG